jgi:hypothetical protein
MSTTAQIKTLLVQDMAKYHGLADRPPHAKLRTRARNWLCFAKRPRAHGRSELRECDIFLVMFQIQRSPRRVRMGPVGVAGIGFMDNQVLGSFSVPQEAVDYAIERRPFANS